MESHYKDSLSAAIVNMLIQCGFENASHRALDELVGIGTEYIKNLALKIADLTEECKLPNPDTFVGLCSIKMHGIDLENLFLFLQNYCDIFPPQPKVYYGPVPLSIAQKNLTELKPPEIVSWAPDIEPALASIGLKYENNQIITDPNFDQSKIWKSYQSPKVESDNNNDNIETSSYNPEISTVTKYGAICKYELPVEAMPTKYEPPTIDFDSTGNLIGVNGKLGKLPDAFISELDEQELLRRKTQFADKQGNLNSKLNTPHLFNSFRSTKKPDKVREKSEEDADDSGLIQTSKPATIASNQHLPEIENEQPVSPLIVDKSMTANTASDEAWNAALQAKIEPIGTFSKQIEKSLDNNTLSTINNCDTNEQISISKSRKRTKRHRLSSRSRKKRRIYSPNKHTNDTINIHNHQPDENTFPTSNSLREEQFNESTVDSNYSVPYSQQTPTNLYNRDLNTTVNISQHNSDDNYRDHKIDDRFKQNNDTNHVHQRDIIDSHNDIEHVDMVETIIKPKSKKKSHKKSSFTNKRKKKKPQKLVEIQTSSIHNPDLFIPQNSRPFSSFSDDANDNDDVNNNIVNRQNVTTSPASDITEPMHGSDDEIINTNVQHDFSDIDVNDNYNPLHTRPNHQQINNDIHNHKNVSPYNHERNVYSSRQSPQSDQSVHYYNQSSEQHVYTTMPSEEHLSPSPPPNYPYYSSQNKTLHHTESIHEPESIYDTDDDVRDMSLKIRINPKKHHKHKYNHCNNNTHSPSEIGGRGNSPRLSSDENVNINDEAYEQNSLSERLEQIHDQSSPLSFKNDNSNNDINNLSPVADSSPHYNHKSHSRSYNYNNMSPINHHSNRTPIPNHNHSRDNFRSHNKYYTPSNNSLSPRPPNNKIYDNDVSQSPMIPQDHHLSVEYNDYPSKSLAKSSKKKNKSSRKSKTKKQKHSSAHKSMISVADIFSDEEDQNHKHLKHKPKKANQYSHSTSHTDVRVITDNHLHQPQHSPITHSPYQNSSSALSLKISKSALSKTKSKNKNSALSSIPIVTPSIQPKYNSVTPAIIPGQQVNLSQLKYCCAPGQAYYTTGEGALVYICPICALEDNGSLMVCCDKCQDWYHGLCLQIFSAPPEDQEWYCPRCSEIESKSLYKTSKTVSSSSRHHTTTSNKKSKSKSTHSKGRSKK